MNFRDVNPDDEQNRRIRDLETRINATEITLSSILAKVEMIHSTGKILTILIGAAIGVDVLPMLGDI